LFIARIEEQKGVLIAIETMKFLNKTGQYHLKIAGEGSFFKRAVEKVEKEKIDNIEFLGQIKDLEKHNALLNSDLLFLPSYSEGMPISIIEGILYGLVIVSRPIGGIPDWVKVPENGVLSNSLEPSEYAEIIINLCEDEETMFQIKMTNEKYGQSYLTPDALNNRLFEYYREVMIR
jgi:glycosyltransferase involved in cell wall biosynthesis